jgi:hypothetical protein
MLHQPGEAWLYNTCSDIQGVLIARASGRSLPDFVAERIFEPLGMVDTGFHVPEEKHAWLPPYHGDVDGALWNEPPVFPSGAGGLVSTLADWDHFARMLLAEGDGLLSRESVRLMMTDHLTPEQRSDSTIFLGGEAGVQGIRRARRPVRRHRSRRARLARHRPRRDPAHAGADDRPDLDPAHAPVLGVRLRRETVTEELELEVAGRSLRLTSPDKVLFSERGETKLDRPLLPASRPFLRRRPAATLMQLPSRGGGQLVPKARSGLCARWWRQRSSAPPTERPPARWCSPTWPTWSGP